MEYTSGDKKDVICAHIPILHAYHILHFPNFPETLSVSSSSLLVLQNKIPTHISRTSILMIEEKTN
jgi:hypothetical protein